MRRQWQGRCPCESPSWRRQKPTPCSAWGPRSCPNNSAKLSQDTVTCHPWVIHPEWRPGLGWPPGPHYLDPPWPADSWTESWGRGIRTPWTSLLGVWCFCVTKHESHFCVYPNPGLVETQSWKLSVLMKPPLGVQRVPWSAGVKPGTSSRRGCPSSPWVCLYGNYPGNGWDSHLCWHW